MSDLKEKLAKAFRLHCGRLSEYEVREDFPLLRLNKSVQAYRIIATFHTMPFGERLEMVAVSEDDQRCERQKMLRQAFYNRMDTHTIAELNDMANSPAPLQPGPPATVHQAQDGFRVFLRRYQERLPRAEIRRCFLARLREVYESKIRPCGRRGPLYEATTPVGKWDLVTRLDFGGSYQFRYDFIIRHEQLEDLPFLSLGYVLGFGDVLGWDDVTRGTLEEDAQKAARLCAAMHSFFREIILATGD